MQAIKNSKKRNRVLGFILVVGLLGHPLLAETKKRAETLSMPSPGMALPAQVLRCQTAKDCVAIRGTCGIWVVVNQQNEKTMVKHFSDEARAIDCAPTKAEGKPKVECRKGYCELEKTAGAGEASVNLWMDRCGEKSYGESLLEKEREALAEPLLSLVELLNSPLTWEQKQGVAGLAKLGQQAKMVTPILMEKLRVQAGVISKDQTTCSFGGPLSEEELIGALSDVGGEPHPALPLLKEWLRDEKQVYRHTEVLQHLRRLGKAAAPALDVVGEVLKASQDKDWRDENGQLALEIAAQLGAEARPLLPDLQRWVESSPSMKGKLLSLMIHTDSASPFTLKAARAALEQKQDLGARVLALHYLTQHPEELRGRFSLLQKMLIDSQNAATRLGVLRALRAMGIGAASAANVVATLSLENQEDVRRQAALTLKALDPRGQVGLELLSQRVYQGFPYEARYVWKVTDSKETQLELLKSYVYFVTSKRFKFTELKVDSETEKKLVFCISSEDCANRTSAMAAVALLKLQVPELKDTLANAMGASESAIRWDASGAYIALYGSSGAMTKGDKPLARAWAIQQEALRQGGYVRLIDLEDLIAELQALPDDTLRFVVTALKTSESTEVIDAVLLMAAKGSVMAREAILSVLQSKEEQKILSVLNRLPLCRADLGPWIMEPLRLLRKHTDSNIQESALMNLLLFKADAKTS
jgi:hypothetical protein